MNLKQAVADRALDYVQSGMIVGLGSGSTIALFLERLSDQLGAGNLSEVVGVPTSQSTFRRALELGIPLTTLDEHPRVDLAVDGADEVDPDCNLIKGLGMALLREKVVAAHAAEFLVIVDESKLVTRLGTHGPLPVEIVPFALSAHVAWLRGLGCSAEIWRQDDSSPVVTDNGNNLARCWFEDGISDPHGLARLFERRPGIVEHGLFLGMADRVLVAYEDGVRRLES